MKDKTRVNAKIIAREVRLVAADGKQLGVVSISDAIGTARESGLDLVEVAPNSSPPVCRIMDYGKYRYQQSKKHSHKKTVDVKEVKVRPSISDHDLGLKVKNMLRFLGSGNKAKVTMFFRGRERQRPERGMQVFERIIGIIGDQYNVEVKPKLEGNRITMIVAPK
ncbi:translation initiation factor IF-3 [bacterium BMS3Abin07]|nr:translation initiation factor IF-3 [bacterium BMS3Abin07]GBE31486.1 translation initiation factor IF-3 [bacterium BMS3Bbin05]HDO22103.1 translation initiation factor IF-3 [Nitrospirota bacterium]HDZ88202.1 translation initiation factor IF-3 [Nitrospirota bacterium]